MLLWPVRDWGSLSQELGVGRVAEAAVAPCVVSSSESECCELLYPSELRVGFCKSSGYLNSVHISLDYLSSNPSESSDPWVVTRTSGSLAGVREIGSLQLVSERVCGFPASSVCALQWVAVVAVSRAWRVWSLGVFVTWWRSWRWTR
ncbi:hypothetical protein Taro_004499 [Colocasia esculenta]|uniref:Uncharacterized protein n=1 Tax=Colocasia esculenta TaxID=4460 RepID=A0A843TV34_COLES|nr:hypothetical protein [Colocasia esculenta]